MSQASNSYGAAEAQAVIRSILVMLRERTGYAPHIDKEPAVEAGFSHHLPKPRSIERVREILAALR